MYSIEIKICSKNGWFTPDEARAYYKRYDRSGITVHWWDKPERAGTHDATVKYIAGKASAGTGSVNYVLSNDKITLMVNPDNVAWASQSGNATTVSVEFDPRLNDEGYKKAGWLINELRGRYNRHLPLYPHKYWFQTECPGTLSLDRMEQEAQKWARGDYNPKPTPPPVDEWRQNQKVVNKKMYTVSGAKLVDVNTLAVVKEFPLDTPMDVGAETTVQGRQFWQTVYARDNGRSQGFFKDNLKDSPTPPPEPVPQPPVQPEWILNLRDIDDTQYWLKENAMLVDITTGQLLTKALPKDSEFVASALTKVGNVEYRITDYSFKKGMFNGVPVDKLTLTPPGTPDVPPVPDYKEENEKLKKELATIKDKIKQFVDYVVNLFKS